MEQYNNECYESHPPLEITIGGKSYEIHGGSCHEPVIQDADIYISLDNQAPVYGWEQPWNKNEKDQKHLRFFIEDMSNPENTDEFLNALSFVIEQMKKSKKVHVGCTAGHGRTGLFLSALVQTTMGNELSGSAIDYVRKNYCEKAVENVPQIVYLNHVFDIKIPQNDIQEVNEFKEIFKELSELSFSKALKKYHIDDLQDVIHEVDNVLFTRMNNRPILNQTYFSTNKPT